MIYSLLLGTALTVSAPWWLWRMARIGRYREGLGERLGRVPARLRTVIAGRDVLWLHAVSVGEVLAAERLVAELGRALPGSVVVVSTTTAAGQKIARERFGAERVFFYPLDFARCVRPYLQVLRPRLLVLMESELWPRMLVECERAGVPVAVVNARISDRSLPRYLRLRWLWRRLFGRVSIFLAQGDESAQRLRAIGAVRVETTGNLKYDAGEPQPSELVQALAEAAKGLQVIVAGSTLEGEEELILSAWATLQPSISPSVLVLAPRHPQRFRAVEALLSAAGGDRRTFIASIEKEDRGIRFAGMEAGAIVLLDTLGDLAAVYALATVAFVGGSLVPRGGHNPLEAARFGVPVVMGTSYANFREIVDGMRRAEAIRIVTDAGELSTALLQLMHQDGGMGERGRVYFEGQAGATAKTLAALLTLIHGG